MTAIVVGPLALGDGARVGQRHGLPRDDERARDLSFEWASVGMSDSVASVRSFLIRGLSMRARGPVKMTSAHPRPAA